MLYADGGKYLFSVKSKHNTYNTLLDARPRRLADITDLLFYRSLHYNKIKRVNGNDDGIGSYSNQRLISGISLSCETTRRIPLRVLDYRFRRSCMQSSCDNRACNRFR